MRIGKRTKNKERTVLVIVLALVALGIHIIIVSKVRLGLGQVLPLVIKEPLQFDTREVDGCTGGVELKTVANHELEVSKKSLSGGILVTVQLLPHRREVHGFLNDLGVGRNV